MIVKSSVSNFNPPARSEYVLLEHFIVTSCKDAVGAGTSYSNLNLRVF